MTRGGSRPRHRTRYATGRCDRSERHVGEGVRGHPPGDGPSSPGRKSDEGDVPACLHVFRRAENSMLPARWSQPRENIDTRPTQALLQAGLRRSLERGAWLAPHEGLRSRAALPHHHRQRRLMVTRTDLDCRKELMLLRPPAKSAPQQETATLAAMIAMSPRVLSSD